MLTYAMRLSTRYDGMVVASFPDVPDAIGYGRDDEEAREEGLKALEAALDAHVRAGEPLPLPRASGTTTVTTTRFAAANEQPVAA
jgi:predicted RNase H-like HicB family nuclease